MTLLRLLATLLALTAWERANALAKLAAALKRLRGNRLCAVVRSLQFAHTCSIDLVAFAGAPALAAEAATPATCA